MDPATGGIIAAGIIAIGSLGGNVVLVWFRRLEKRRTKRLLEGTDKVFETMSKDAEKRYGYGYGARSVKSRSLIEDLEGKARITREYYGVEVIAESIRLPAFPEEVWVAPPGTIVNKPQLLPGLTKANFRKHIGLENEQCEEQVCRFNVEVQGGLTKADGEIDFGFHWTCSKAVCITKEEAAETYTRDIFKKEYHSFDVRFPIDELEIEIEFPKGYNVRTFPGVFLAGSEIWHDVQLQRIKEGIQETDRGARLKIAEPRIGYRYLIFWEPLSLRQVQQLTSR
jgi:hypothetical protein